MAVVAILIDNQNELKSVIAKLKAVASDPEFTGQSFTKCLIEIKKNSSLSVESDAKPTSRANLKKKRSQKVA